MHATEHILLVRPSEFVFNTETAASNTFQNKLTGKTSLATAATKEFDLFAEKLKASGVNVIIMDDTAHPVKPDAVFPNNWVTFHHDGRVILYPMYAHNRRAERRPDIIDKLKKDFEVKEVIDLSNYEREEKYLEGTGSIIFDHINKIAYACLSPRTDKDLFIRVTNMLFYRPVYFHAFDRSGIPVYHTNVMMCIAEKFAIVCMECIAEADRKQVKNSLASSGHEVIEISISQMNNFAGNMLAVKNNAGEDILVLSQSAFDSLTKDQREKISEMCLMLPMPIKTIETVGGGSARCMMAEVFLPLKKK